MQLLNGLITLLNCWTILGQQGLDWDTNGSGSIQNQECSYFHEHFCNPSGADLLLKVEEMVESPEQCEEFCGNYNSNMAGMKRFKRSPGLPLDGPGRPDLDDQDYKNQENDKEKCNYFTYLSHRGRSSCYLLSGCSEQKPECTERSACVSGGIDCHVGKVCPKLVHKSGEHSRWRCEKVNPYTKDIPAGTFCHTWCPSWRNKKGELVTAQSVCQEDGSWSQSVAFPPGPLSTPATLPRPDDQDPPCGCEPLTLTYNPNEEKGTEFYCNTQLNWTTLPLPLLTDNVCHLLCDKGRTKYNPAKTPSCIISYI